jgi:hypothetical protein
MTDLMDQLDERLAAAGRRWQAEQPPPPAVPLERLDEPVDRSVPWRPLLVAAAAIVLMAGTVALGELGPGSTPARPTDHQTGVVHREPRPPVPWRELKAKHPKVGHRSQGRMVTPFDNISANGHIHGHAQPGDTLTFTVVLESYRDVPLDPCPDYSIHFGARAVSTWQLNCTQVPYRDVHGRPLLPALKSVRFQMQVTVPDVHGRQKVLWSLDGPTTMPGFYGLVHVS